jgi:NADP-dependent 3-hydroxy acid dehydrogenase YdfG
MPAETRDITGTVVAVTGASSGIGAASVRLLAEAGAKVSAQARHADRLDKVAAEVGGDVLTVPGDVGDPAAARELVARTIEQFGRIDSIVVNAGIGAYGGILDGTDAELDEMMRTNFAGSVWGIRSAVEAFRQSGTGGDVVVISSVAGLRGGGQEAVYAATKFAQVGLAGSLDREVQGEGIRVSTICPAGVDTEFAIGRGRTRDDPALRDFLHAEDIAAAVVTVLRQPRRMRTTLWAMYSMAESS